LNPSLVILSADHTRQPRARSPRRNLGPGGEVGQAAPLPPFRPSTHLPSSEPALPARLRRERSPTGQLSGWCRAVLLLPRSFAPLLSHPALTLPLGDGTLNLQPNIRSGSSWPRAERAAGSAADRRNLIWVIPAKGDHLTEGAAGEPQRRFHLCRRVPSGARRWGGEVSSP
jgi:hypothetical protein